MSWYCTLCFCETQTLNININMKHDWSFQRTELKNWNKNDAEEIDPFKLRCWRRLLRIPWTACQEIKPVNPKRNQPWLVIGRTEAKAETPILWPPDGKSQLTGKDPDAGKDVRQGEKGTTEDEMVEWHHRLNAHEFEQALGVGDGQGTLACCSSWGLRVRLNWATKLTILKTKKKSTLKKKKKKKKKKLFVYNLFYVLQ